jgi:hypothetical protein
MGLTETERETLVGIYRRDVSYWEWPYWVGCAVKQGRVSMGLAYVLLRYRPQAGMPRLRKEMNELYWQCLVDRADEYEMRIEQDQGKLFLVSDRPSDEVLEEELTEELCCTE